MLPFGLGSQRADRATADRRIAPALARPSLGLLSGDELTQGAGSCVSILVRHHSWYFRSFFWPPRWHADKLPPPLPHQRRCASNYRRRASTPARTLAAAPPIAAPASKPRVERLVFSMPAPSSQGTIWPGLQLAAELPDPTDV